MEAIELLTVSKDRYCREMRVEFDENTLPSVPSRRGRGDIEEMIKGIKAERRKGL